MSGREPGNSLKRKAPQNDAPSKRTRRLGKCVSLIALPSEEEFEIHENLLKASSSYFKSVLESEFKEGLERIIKLEETEPEILELFQNWIYFQDALNALPDPRSVDKFILYKLYFFADMRGIPALMNYVTDKILLTEHWDSRPITLKDDLQFIYNHTSDQSGLRSLAVDIFCSKMADRKVLFRPRRRQEKLEPCFERGDLDGVSRETLVDLVCAMMTKTPKTSSEMIDNMSIYHTRPRDDRNKGDSEEGQDSNEEEKKEEEEEEEEKGEEGEEVVV